MVEIAISLAVIGFALVAIIGVLPLGINVQKENREETIICQDASVFLNAIRGGARGMDDLTNYVIAITNNVWRLTATTNPPGFPTTAPDQVNWYTYTTAQFKGAPTPSLRLANGARIVGLLSTPKYVRTNLNNPDDLTMNQIVAYFRALSGSAFEKVPQTNADILNLSFAYRLIPELTPVPTIESDSIYARTYETNLHELRLAFRWPKQPNDQLGNSRQVFRTLVGGRLAATDFNQTNSNVLPFLYFLQPSTFATAAE